MTNNENQKYINFINERGLSVLVFSLFFSWLLAFPFEGQVLYALLDKYNLDPSNIIFTSIIAHLVGLFCSSYFVKSMNMARRLLIASIIFCIVGTILFLFKPSVLWNIALIITSFITGASVAAWAFYFKAFTPANERIKTAAESLIYTNILMIVLNFTAINISIYAGLILSIAMLGAGLFFTIKLPNENTRTERNTVNNDLSTLNMKKPLTFLCFFIIIITINSGLMYRVINPDFAHLEKLTSWYWAVPYIAALYLMKNFSYKVNRSYMLYVAIAMIGFAFIFFMILNRSAISYIIVDTFLLGACGIYDLFWWSIIGEMLDYTENPVKILGIGLSSNVIGVLIGGLIGNAIYGSHNSKLNSSVIALVIVFIILIILPLLHNQLSNLLKNHAYLMSVQEKKIEKEKEKTDDKFTGMDILTERENEIVNLLLNGRTYKMIAEELFLSENTVKTHIKNIYSKLNIQSKSQLIKMLNEKDN